MRNFRFGSVRGVPINVNITLPIFLILFAWLVYTRFELWTDLVTLISIHTVRPQFITADEWMLAI
ncbi:MAG: hypothetical protein SXQ77_04010, partial [Halobacteria archaeon]|nr:hypothetical protein [Halobacteria archaeon]